jgi:hypothetical protein
MSVFMEHNLPGILFGHVEKNEAAIRAALKKAGELGRFPLKERRELPQLLLLRKAMICNGTGVLTLAFTINEPKTARICSKRAATSRPRLSFVSVTTEKCGECTSNHWASPQKAGSVRNKTATNRKHLRIRTF